MTIEAPTAKRRSKLKTPAIAAAAGILGLIVGAAGGGSSDATTTSAAPAPATTITVAGAPAPAPAAETVTVTAKPVAPAGPSGSILEDGVFLIGSDVKAGTYKSAGGDLCYWARLKDVSGSGIIVNGFGGGRQVVSIKSSDKAFKTEGCGEWKRIA